MFKKFNKTQDPKNHVHTLFSGTYRVAIRPTKAPVPSPRQGSTLSGGICYLNFLLLYCRGDPGNSERVAGTLSSSILETFYFSETEFCKYDTKFQNKRGGRSHLSPSLNPPMYCTSRNTKITK